MANLVDSDKPAHKVCTGLSGMPLFAVMEVFVVRKSLLNEIQSRHKVLSLCDKSAQTAQASLGQHYTHGLSPVLSKGKLKYICVCAGVWREEAVHQPPRGP